MSDKGRLEALWQALRSSRTKALPLPMTMDASTRKLMLALGLTLLTFIAWRLCIIPELHPLTIAPDQSMFVAIGDLLLQGKKPYVDIYDVNPPLAFYAHIVPALVSRVFSVTPPQAFWYTAIALWTYSVGLSFWLLWRETKHDESFVFMPLLLAFSYFTLFLSGLDEFGQREHIFVLLFLPFFIVRWLRWNGSTPPVPAALTAALLASVGIYFKPSYLLAAVLLEVFWLVNKQRWRSLFAPEAWVCALFGVGYGAYLLAMPVEMKNGYFGMMVPVFTLGYGEYGTSLLFQLMGWGTFWKEYFLLFIYSIIAGLFLSRFSTLIIPLIVFSVWGFVSYLIQGQPWLNHAIPFLAGTYMLVGIEAAVIISIVRQFFFKYQKTFDTILVSFICLWQLQVNWQEIDHHRKDTAETTKLSMHSFGYKGEVPKRDLLSLADEIIKYTYPGDTVLFMTRSIAPGYPLLLQTNRQPASRYLHAMLLPTTIFASDISKSQAIKDKMKGYRTRILEDYEADIKQNNPKLIFVQATRIWDILQDANFVKKVLLENYQFAGIVDDHRIYVRKDLSNCPPPLRE